MKYWPSEHCESCGTWLFTHGTPGVDQSRRYPTEAQFGGRQLQTFDLFPEHSPARCISLKKRSR